ncbi:MAG: hypothetical protein MK089_04810 [Phycisphaerales bacterium]|nr:hypothetical protein [Phycisphaerales bacterium]
MSSELGTLCSDFYVNQRVALTMDLPAARQTVLDLFDRIKREMPGMKRFKRYEGELALESPDQEGRYCWVGLRRTSVRSGWVNPESLEQSYHLHRLLLETAPYFLSISPLDVEAIELVFGFDLHARRNRNEVVFDALLAGSPLSAMVQSGREEMIDVQPFLGIALDESARLQASLEIKTRMGPAELQTKRWEDEPISVYLTVRREGPFETIEEFKETFAILAGHLERLAEERVIPGILVPLHGAIL